MSSVNVNARAKCVYGRVVEGECVFERGRQFVSLRDQKKKERNSLCVALLYEDLRMDIWRLQGRLLFPVVMESQVIWGIVRVLFCRGQISSNTKTKRAFHVTVNVYHCNC